MSIASNIKYKVIKKTTKEKVKPSSYDFNEYTNIEDMKGYIGFITPQGTFFRVRQLGKANGSHGEWAFGYLYELGLKPSMINYNENILRLTDDPNFNFTIVIESQDPHKPIYFCPGIQLTEAQVKTINELCYTEQLDEEVVLGR